MPVQIPGDIDASVHYYYVRTGMDLVLVANIWNPANIGTHQQCSPARCLSPLVMDRVVVADPAPAASALEHKWPLRPVPGITADSPTLSSPPAAHNMCWTSTPPWIRLSWSASETTICVCTVGKHADAAHSRTLHPLLIAVATDRVLVVASARGCTLSPCVRGRGVERKRLTCR